MTDTFEFTLNNPLTEEQWDMISDVDFDQTDRVTFHTKHGKEVEFIKVIRCMDCVHYVIDELKKDETEDRRHSPSVCLFRISRNSPDWYCADAERREE